MKQGGEKKKNKKPTTSWSVWNWVHQSSEGIGKKSIGWGVFDLELGIGKGGMSVYIGECKKKEAGKRKMRWSA